MTTKTKTHRLTFDEFCVLVKDGQKADLIDGVIHMASPENTDANDLFVWLIRLFADFVDVKELGKVYGSRVAFRVSDHESPEPDIAFIRKDRQHLVHKGYVAGGPDLAIEIVSPESVDRDYVKKKEQYRLAGVVEYWIIDQIEEKVTLYRLDLKGKYREVKARKGVLSSDVVPGFKLQPDWLWQTPLPKKGQILAQLLAE